ncbi:hypothetical protein Cgig2_022260 [Carnegiea gigantea]|uniref:Uncharacterized protein n=1 Tax=Carnegiea gigantea TaxID=171969 RepID=A0A9Q1KG50_9CARY|nr:hypothetical protein Cgig2_022260 [Carnegiea gigantea]
MAEIPKPSNASDNPEILKLNENEEGYDHHDDDPDEDGGDEENYEYALQITAMLSFPMVMQTAIELDLLGVIARAGPGRQLSTAEIAAALPAAGNPDAPAILDRMLYLLASYSVVTCTAVDSGASGGVVRKYGLAPVAKYFVPNKDGVSLGAVISLNHSFPQQLPLASPPPLEGASRGIPFNKVHGMDAFEYQGTNPRFNKTFNKAMYDQTTYIIKKIVRRYKGFENTQKLVDVGGGLGHTLRVITSNYPSIKGINFDLPHVIQHAPTIPGVEHVGGDMFESIPHGDAIFMKNDLQQQWILHDWSDEHCLKILKNCYKALLEKGKVIVVETNMMEEPQTMPLAKAISQMDVCMMTQNPGGKERTRREFQALAEAAGFAEFNPVCCISSFWVMELLK